MGLGKREEALENHEASWCLCLVSAVHVSSEVLCHWVVPGRVPCHLLAKRTRKYQILYVSFVITGDTKYLPGMVRLPRQCPPTLEVKGYIGAAPEGPFSSRTSLLQLNFHKAQKHPEYCFSELTPHRSQLLWDPSPDTRIQLFHDEVAVKNKGKIRGKENSLEHSNVQPGFRTTKIEPYCLPNNKEKTVSFY